MTKFLDGPAAGISLDLARTPFVLRATFNPLTGEWDALDQHSDEATAAEQITLYRLASQPTPVHICRSPRSKSGWTAWAEYAVYPEQPADSDMRDNRAFDQWCLANMAKLFAGTWAEKKQGMFQVKKNG